jgi:hypothetical protein
MTNEQFWKLVEKTDSCWIWHGARNASGYGSVWVNGKWYKAHRYSFLQANNYLPKMLDHTCVNPPCVNPAHLCPTTYHDNAPNLRTTHCPHGHEYTEENTRVDINGHRHCKACRKLRYPGIANKDKTHCPHGHEYTPENTLRQGYARRCRICERERGARRRDTARMCGLL